MKPNNFPRKKMEALDVLASLASFLRANNFGHILDTQILQRGLFHRGGGP
jgi:hypothetical protein